MTAESFADLLRIHAESAVALQDQFDIHQSDQSDQYTLLKKDYAELVQVNAALYTAFSESHKESLDIKTRVRNIADLCWKKLSKGAL